MQMLIRFLISCLLFTMPAGASAGAAQVSFADIRNELEASVAGISAVIDRLEALQRVMDRSAKANRNYDEQKNIFLSSMLAIETTAAVCRYEADQLTLFLDLRKKNRLKYYGIRIESLETSIRQIHNMRQQIQINYLIFPADFFERSIVKIEQAALADALSALQKSIDLVRSVQKNE